MVPIEEESGSAVEHPVYEASIKVLKVVVYLLTFVIVLGGCMVAKGTMLFMTSQLKMDKKLSYCDKDSGEIPKCVITAGAFPNMYFSPIIICYITACFSDPIYIRLSNRGRLPV